MQSRSLHRLSQFSGTLDGARTMHAGRLSRHPAELAHGKHEYDIHVYI
jgi:hypothetical protein